MSYKSKEDQTLTEFLAWIEDNFTNAGEDNWIGVHDNDSYTREQIIEQFKDTMED